MILSPLFFIIAVGIFFSSPGSVLYKTERAGKDGKPFKMFKFRSMRLNNGNNSRITGYNDSRIFPFGKFIRFLKFDELPQLLNILIGDMSVIGPRPEDQSIVNQYYTPLLRKSLSVRPGLASPGSIFNYTHLNKEIDEKDAEEKYVKDILPLKVKLDVVYSTRQNFFYDLELIFRTLWVIISQMFGKRNFSYPKEYFEALRLTEKNP